MGDNLLAKAWDYLSVQEHKPCSNSHMDLDFFGLFWKGKPHLITEECSKPKV